MFFLLSYRQLLYYMSNAFAVYLFVVNVCPMDSKFLDKDSKKFVFKYIPARVLFLLHSEYIFWTSFLYVSLYCYDWVIFGGVMCVCLCCVSVVGLYLQWDKYKLW